MGVTKVQALLQLARKNHALKVSIAALRRTKAASGSEVLHRTGTLPSASLPQQARIGQLLVLEERKEYFR
jgi:hypothetical protein